MAESDTTRAQTSFISIAVPFVPGSATIPVAITGKYGETLNGRGSVERTISGLKEQHRKRRKREWQGVGEAVAGHVLRVKSSAVA